MPLDRLHPASWNPRTIKDERFQNLVRSIQADPDFLWRRPILATADGTIYAGNMRFRAAQQLSMGTVPAIIEDIPEQLAKERALRDNHQWGDWQDDQLGELVFGLRTGGADLTAVDAFRGRVRLGRLLEAQRQAQASHLTLVGADRAPCETTGRGRRLACVLVPASHRHRGACACQPVRVARPGSAAR